MLLSAIWLFVVACGMSRLWKYESSAGPTTAPPEFLPADTQSAEPTGGCTMLMFAHPRCPCTRASIGELARIMSRCSETIDANVLFYVPPGVVDDWARTDLWRSAADIPGVSVHEDHDGAEARRFRAVTSGFTLLYDANGRLIFAGGITGSRGHAGDNAGSNSILQLTLGGESRLLRQTPVFGCSLHGSDEFVEREKKVQ